MIIARLHYFRIRFVCYQTETQPKNNYMEECEKLAKSIKEFPGIYVTEDLKNPHAYRLNNGERAIIWLWVYKILNIEDKDTYDRFMKLLEDSPIRVTLEDM